MTSAPRGLAERLARHVEALRACRRCPRMHPPAVCGGAVVSRVLLVGQAPGEKEPGAGRLFAWRAGRTLFGWFEQAAGVSEERFRATVYLAAVCRCFPGKKPTGGDRVPSEEEIANCAPWLRRELELLKPELVIPVGRLAIEQFLPSQTLDKLVGRRFKVWRDGRSFDVIPLPHPSGASPWHRVEPGRTLLRRALALIAAHPAFRDGPGDQGGRRRPAVFSASGGTPSRR